MWVELVTRCRKGGNEFQPQPPSSSRAAQEVLGWRWGQQTPFFSAQRGPQCLGPIPAGTLGPPCTIRKVSSGLEAARRYEHEKFNFKKIKTEEPYLVIAD